ncbi:hypothetical protein EAL2_c09850 [Peptoclostridium acidaminophilum DSM 3953]|uniref:UPF0291 protein EAL2_c09850 n=1 Tax=Peptoclostridium acidaminophilum DSM 3953 TaxID=1286171 RepID=W8T3E4_PEPAC|nr:DUF896 domain-containing protein [Peptoclostridium acidaminophilum]AHM56284.1 hypothetical protein EAL2_c09850 [Peptoclostridium acidaminophilum DSM 3953]
MVTEEKIARINYLAKKSKDQGLTDAEKQEQAKLRAEYVSAVKANLKSQLDSIKIVEQ